MNSLREKLLAAVACDDDVFHADVAYYDSRHVDPLLTALIDCAVALERQQYPHVESFCKERAKEALAALAEAVGEK